MQKKGTFLTRGTLLHLTALVRGFLIAGLLGGCAPLPGLRHIRAYQNDRLTESQNFTKTNLRTIPAQGYPYFIGMALSGGGSRAANFSASVMWELDRLGILEHVQYISAVSGSALPAAYYALFKHQSDRWNEGVLKRAMAQDFESRALLYLLAPWRWPFFLGTGYDRSDVLAEVFSNRLFQRRTFNDLPEDAPTLLLNATDYSHGVRFVFSDHFFDNMRSDLGRLPIAVGVTASAAFPGALRSVTLRNFATRADTVWRNPLLRGVPGRYPNTTYVHLIDGGVIDNLGLDTLERTYLELSETLPSSFQQGCLLILVDAQTPYEGPRLGGTPDPRGIQDVVIDTNVFPAIGALMWSKRKQELDAIGFNASHRSNALFKTQARGTGSVSYRRRPEEIAQPPGFLEQAHLNQGIFLPRDEDAEGTTPRKPRPPCKVWLITLTDLTPNGWGDGLESDDLYEEGYQRLYEQRFHKPFWAFQEELSRIPTRFRISREHVDEVDAAGTLLVREPKSRETICRWFLEITGSTCNVPEGPSAE